MKATGIIRKIDELGRVVIPKEIRKTLRVREGDSMEIFVDETSSIMLKKYSVLGEMKEISKACSETINKVTGFTCIVTDKESVIYVTGQNKKDYDKKDLNENIITIMQERQLWTTKESRCISVISGKDTLKCTLQIIVPIIADGEVIGSIIVLSNEKTIVAESDIRLIESFSLFISRIMAE